MKRFKFKILALSFDFLPFYFKGLISPCVGWTSIKIKAQVMIKSDMTDVTLEFFFFEHTLWLKNKLYLRFIEFTIKFIRYLKILKIKKLR